VLDRNLVLPLTLAALADERPEGLALVDVDGRTVTYEVLFESILQWAGAYRGLGVEAEQAVLTMMPSSVEAYVAWLGAAWLRAVEVPLNTAYSGDVLADVINTSEAEVLVTATAFVNQLAAVAHQLPHLRTVVVHDLPGDRTISDLPFRVLSKPRFLECGDAADRFAGPDYYDIAAVLQTSGTTGPPKGVLVPWAELSEFTRIPPADAVPEGTGVYAAGPPFHISAKVLFYLAMTRKAKLVFRESLSLDDFWDDIRNHDVALAWFSPPVWEALLQRPPEPDDADNPLRYVCMTPIIPRVEMLKKRFGIGVAPCPYASTEIGVPLMADSSHLRNTRSCGRPRQGPPGYEVRVVDEHDEALGPNRAGELVVRASEPWVMSPGYWKLPEKTGAAWRNGWFHTGDAFSYDDDHNFYFVDRMNDTLRRAGEAVSSLQIEAAVTEHPAVAECAVVAVATDRSDDDIKACVVLETEQGLSPEELNEFAVSRLPGDLVPRYIEFLDRLPRTEATFRVQKSKLRADALTDRTWDRKTVDTTPSHDGEQTA
jgi:crotonobetaine/carnitine-CoA ligase